LSVWPSISSASKTFHTTSSFTSTFYQFMLYQFLLSSCSLPGGPKKGNFFFSLLPHLRYLSLLCQTCIWPLPYWLCCCLFPHVILTPSQFVWVLPCPTSADTLTDFSHMAYSLPWWWRQYAPLKYRSTSMRLHGAMSQMAVIFVLTTMRIWNLTECEDDHRYLLAVGLIIF
jgi:hypothetical protein